MNVVWFALDTLRSDHLGCYGYFRPTSPNIDRLAAEGAVFEDSYASAIATGPGFTSLVTGLAAVNHGFYLTPWNVPNAPLLDDRVPTVAELVQARGPTTTAAFDNLINFRSHMKQFVRGVEFYINVTRSPAWLHHHVLGESVNARLLPWLEAHAAERFFAMVHYWDPHMPYNQPEAFRGHFDRESRDLATETAPDGYTYVPGWGPADRLPEAQPQRSIDLYDDEILYTDHCVGQVVEKLDALGILDETAILLTSDHGEDLDLHGLWGHGTVHETTVRVPLVLRDPARVPRGVRVRGFVQHADNAPTILEYFPQEERDETSLAAPSPWMPETDVRFDGASLGALARGERQAPREIVVECPGQRACIAPPWKLIASRDGSPAQLFHLANDPCELHDRAAEQRAVAEELEGKLRQWVEHHLAGQRTDPMDEPGGAWNCWLER
ncbi:MAG: sulfatase [Candidatus Brocadiia bacterium]